MKELWGICQVLFTALGGWIRYLKTVYEVAVIWTIPANQYNPLFYLGGMKCYNEH